MRPIKRVAEVGYRNNERLPLGLIVKEQVGLGQMLVCYESILTGESRAIWRPLLEKREKWRTHGCFGRRFEGLPRYICHDMWPTRLTVETVSFVVKQARNAPIPGQGRRKIDA
jgi:hypothetical protein